MSLLENLMRRTVRMGASDLHIQAGQRPRIRLQGSLVFAHEQSEPLSAVQVVEFMSRLFDEQGLRELSETGTASAAFRDPSGVQWRLQGYQQVKGPAVALRPLAREVPTLAALHLPPQLERLISLHRGLVLVTGPTGSGKSTTLAAILQGINERYRKSIITLEDPVEYELENAHCLVAQRAVGRDVATFEQGLRDALSERPDVLSVGELRSLETIRLALKAAEMGLLVFGTLHAADAAQSLRRMIEVFPACEQALQREKLAQTLQAVVSQALLHESGGRGRFPACELLLRTQAVAHLIREGKIQEVRNCIQTGGEQGMLLLDDALVELVSTGRVALEEARYYATDARRLPRARPRRPTTRRRLRKAQVSSRERRVAPRIATLALVNVEVFDEVGFRSELSTGRTLDLSAGGARVDLDHSVLLGTRVQATFALDNQVVEVDASVRSAEPLPEDRFAIGLHFEKTSKAAKAALAEHLRIHG